MFLDQINFTVKQVEEKNSRVSVHEPQLPTTVSCSFSLPDLRDFTA